MNADFQDIDVISELNVLSSENKYQEIVDLLRENLYQFNNDPKKLIATLTLRIYYNLLLKSFADVDSDFELIESIFRDKLSLDFSYTRESSCSFSTFLLYCYYPHLKGQSFVSLDRLHSLLNRLEKELNDEKVTREEIASDDTEDSAHVNPDEVADSESKDLTKGTSPEVVDRITKTGLLLSDVLFSLLRPLEAIRILTRINLRYNKGDLPTNMMLSILYRKLGFMEESRACLGVFWGLERETFYQGILKVFEKDYRSAVRSLKSFRKSTRDSEKKTRENDIVVNNLAVAYLYAKRSQEARYLLSNLAKHGLQAHRGILSNADVLKELSIYD